MAPRALVVEDDHSIALLLQAVLAHESIDCDHAEDGAVALSRIAQFDYGAILLDLLLPVVNGFEVLRRLRAGSPEVLGRVIIVTAAAESTWKGCDEIAMVHTLLRKPIDIGELMGHVQTCMATQIGKRNASLG